MLIFPAARPKNRGDAQGSLSIRFQQFQENPSKGFGEIGVPVTICGTRVYPGDWLVGDGDGVVHIPKDRLVGVANRAQGVLELENRLRREIKESKTLSEVMELLRWEKK